MPADILRDLGKDATAAETEAAPQQDVSTQSLLDRIDKSKAAYEATFGTPDEQKAELEAAKRKSDKAEATAETVWGGVVEPGIVGVIKAARQPLPKVPEALPEPPVPSLKGREYLDVPEKHALGALVTGLGVMAQLAMAGKAPVAALSALTGAMEGWHTGDAERAQRDWRTYIAQVDQIRTENRQNMDRFEAAMQVHGANITAAQADLVASMYEAGHYQQAAAIARQGVIPAYNQMADSIAHTDHLYDQTLKVIEGMETRRLHAEMQKSMQQATAQYRQSMLEFRKDMERRADAREARQEAADRRVQSREDRAEAKEKKKEDDKQARFASTYTLLNQLDALVDPMDKKHLLMREPGAKEYTWVEARRSPHTPFISQAGDPTLTAWQAHAGTMVAILRQLGDIGPRAKSAYESAINIIEKPTTPEGARAAFKQLREAVRAYQTGKAEEYESSVAAPPPGFKPVP